MEKEVDQIYTLSAVLSVEAANNPTPYKHKNVLVDIVGAPSRSIVIVLDTNNSRARVASLIRKIHQSPPSSRPSKYRIEHRSSHTPAEKVGEIRP